MTDNRFYFAQAYGEGSYNGCDYNNSASCLTSSGSGSSPSSNGVLANTGEMVVLIVSLACLIIFASLVVRFARRGKHTKSLDNTKQNDLQSAQNPKK